MDLARWLEVAPIQAQPRNRLERLVDELLAHETIDKADLEKLLGPKQSLASA